MHFSIQFGFGLVRRPWHRAVDARRVFACPSLPVRPGAGSSVSRQVTGQSAKIRTMISEEERAKLRFELANANLQSVSRAQGLYLTTLLVYICLVWAMFLTGTATFHLESLELKMDAVWKLTPFVTMVLTLAVV